MTNESSKPASDRKGLTPPAPAGTKLSFLGQSMGQPKPSSHKSFWPLVPLSRCPAPPEHRSLSEDRCSARPSVANKTVLAELCVVPNLLRYRTPEMMLVSIR
jgi:hypothetical protein